MFYLFTMLYQMAQLIVRLSIRIEYYDTAL